MQCIFYAGVGLNLVREDSWKPVCFGVSGRLVRYYYESDHRKGLHRQNRLALCHNGKRLHPSSITIRKKFGGSDFIEKAFHWRIYQSYIPTRIQDCALQVRAGTNNRHSNQDGRHWRSRKQVRYIVGNATVAEEGHRPRRLIRVGRQKMIPPKLEAVLLVTTEAETLIRVESLPDWNFTHACKTAVVVMDLFPKRP